MRRQDRGNTWDAVVIAMTDAELDDAIEVARKAAHEAPKEMGGGPMTWARASRDYFRLLDLRDARRVVHG